MGEVQAGMGLPEEDVTFTVHADGADVVYHAVEQRFAVEAIEVRAGDADALTIVVQIDSDAAPAKVQAFDERTILDRYAVSDVVVWKDTGWRERFDLSACYRLTDETTGLHFYEVSEGCAGRSP